MQNSIKVRGARQHNLKNIDLDIPKGKLVVFTGLSGSGKSSLAFDTIYAEGQRRYVESLSSYARQFLGLMTKPDVDSLEGLSPAIAIDQKTTSRNPRSTVGTITEIYDYLRLLYARAGRPHCPNCGKEISQQTLEQIVNRSLEIISEAIIGKKPARFMVLAPVVRDKKGEFSDLFKNLTKKGYSKIRLDGLIHNLADDFLLIKTNRHSIDVVIERLSVTKNDLSKIKQRLFNNLEAANDLTGGLAILTQVLDPGLTFPDKPEQFNDHLFSQKYACPDCNISLPELAPRLFSFNSPHGACPECSGLGILLKVDLNKLIAPSLSLFEGAVIPLASQLSSGSWMSNIVREVFNQYHVDPKTAWQDLDKEFIKVLLHGSAKLLKVSGASQSGHWHSFTTTWEGFVNHLERRYQETDSDYIRSEIGKYMSEKVCLICQGSRLKPEALSVSINGLNIYQLTTLSIKDCLAFTRDVSGLNQKELAIAKLILKEINNRLEFLLAVGLAYLTLSRQAGTLAGGEAQRIRLASQIGTGLTGVLYVLDEPSIGLHQRDNQKLIQTLKRLRDLGNTIIVVEHDKDIMLQADYLVDFGPLAGKKGGRIVASGTPKQVMANSKSLTGKFLKNKQGITITSDYHPGTDNSFLTLTGCSQNNLKDLTVKFPLNQLIVVTGVSGSGKSSLIHDTLYPAVKTQLNPYFKQVKNNYKNLSGSQTITRVALIDQNPIGRTPRSNPATYTKAFDFIRLLFAQTKAAKINGYKPGRFSFNVKGGRCEACQGEGQVKIEMQFMPNVYITCEVCQGKRYQQPTLDILYKDKNISQVLDMTVEEALELFPSYSGLTSKLETLKAVGLDYITLGQPAPTLSGGEAQRVKLARELSVKGGRGHTLYLLDEPTTGLHFEDLKKLIRVLKQLVGQNNTVVVIEHNLEVIKNADWIIDLGPEGGDQGGKVVAQGLPHQIVKTKQSYTGSFLKNYV
ncbi:MAG: excinuclease ABC subunit UvrA [Candidatus Beckwithbacteria bacterium]|nr:excinuclease ABC subunit UvrA [Candidatus Beckwithbacteria bacterium]